MTHLSALSNVRLDNFVYTIDCMRAARARLTPHNNVTLYFMTADHFIHDKLAAMLTLAFDQPPLIHHKTERMFNEIYLAVCGEGRSVTIGSTRTRLASSEGIVLRERAS